MPIKILAALGVAMAVRMRQDHPVSTNAEAIFASYAQGVTAMQAAPINPDWIIKGHPQARISAGAPGFDGSAGSALWDCTAGTFRWFFDRHETIVVLEGSVRVTLADGTERRLQKGDVAFFHAGTWATWHIETYLRKAAFIKRPTPPFLSSLLRLLRKMKALLGREAASPSL